MSNSSLIDGTLLTENCTKPRRHRIDTITPHYMCGYVSAEQCCRWFTAKDRKASANYCIGKDGEIFLNVEECNRAWTSGSASNDNRAVTIECANFMDPSHYGVLPDVVWDSLVRLCIDICERNGIQRIKYTGGLDSNLTKHCWFQDTDCPGPWLTTQFDRLAGEINASLKPAVETEKGFGGEYICMVDKLNVRTRPALDGVIVAQYTRGETVWLDNTYVVHDGYVWGRYTGFISGEKRYVAVGPYTGKPEPDDYLIKI